MNRILNIVFVCCLLVSFTFSQDIAQKRASGLGTGVNLTFLDNYWKGTKERHFVDFLDRDDFKLRETMISDIASAGYTSIRIPVCFSAWTSLEAPYRWETTEGLEALDKMINWSLANGLKVIIDQHHPELDGSFPAAAKIERIDWIWKQVAARYKKTDPEGVFFELWNEPHDIEATVWRKYAERLIRTVRAIAPSHTLIVGFHDWNSRQAMVDSRPFEDKNIIYTFHFYDPFVFTHQGASWSAEGLPEIKGVPFPYDGSVRINTPASAEGKWSGGLIENYKRDSSKDKIFTDLEAAKRWSESHGVPVFVGEFGSYTKYAANESRCRHFELLYSSFRKLGFPNAAWEWDGGFNMFEQGTNQIMPCVREAAGLKKAAGWKLTWNDEFEGKAGTAVDAGKWRHEIGGAGWGNKEFQFYTDSVKNAFHDGEGSLVVKAIEEKPPGDAKCWYGECRYTSARLVTKGIFAQKYGRFEARVKVPYGQGIWPAFWLLGDDIDEVGWPECGEIDIMENIGREPMQAHGTIHGPGYSGSNGIGKSYKLKENQKFTDDYHLFAVEWEPDVIRWYIDGDLYHTARPRDLPKGSKWVFDHPHFILLNLAVGGNWPGDPDETTVFPQMMKIDYVRVYAKAKD